MCIRDRAGLYSGGNASLDVFLQAHAGSPVRVDRADREAYLDHPALVFGLALRPCILQDVASGRRFRGSGLLARFLYAMPASNVGKRDVRRRSPIPQEVRNAYEAGILGLLDKRPMVVCKPVMLPFSEQAREPVSYTHLDVYKRQHVGRPFVRLVSRTKSCF